MHDNNNKKSTAQFIIVQNIFICMYNYFFYRSLLDPDVDASFPEDGPVTFEEISMGTKRGGRKLVSSDGFTYTVKVHIK